MQWTIGKQCGISAWKIGETDNKLVMDTVGFDFVSSCRDATQGWKAGVWMRIENPCLPSWLELAALLPLITCLFHQGFITMAQFRGIIAEVEIIFMMMLIAHSCASCEAHAKLFFSSVTLWTFRWIQTSLKKTWTASSQRLMRTVQAQWTSTSSVRWWWLLQRTKSLNNPICWSEHTFSNCYYL